MSTKFGIRLPVAGPLASPAAIGDAARRAEELGYDSLWVHDFIGWTKEMDRSHVSCGSIELIEDDSVPVMFEAMTTLAYVAAITSRATIGTAILCTPYRNPVVQAKQLAAIDVLSGGRLIVGAGVGALKRIGQDFEVVGVPREGKYERTHEYLRLMREIWENPFPRFEGQYVTLPETEINPKPVQSPVPIWFGGKGEKSLAITADIANGWLPTWLTPDGYREFLPTLYGALEARGRSTEDFTIAKECYAAIGETGEEVRAFTGRTFDTFTHGFTVKTYDEATASALVGTPDDICEQVLNYREAGVEHFEMKFIYRSVSHLLEQLEMFADSVIAKVGR